MLMAYISMHSKRDYLKIHVKRMNHLTHILGAIKAKYAKIALTNKKLVQDLSAVTSHLIKYGKSVDMAQFLACYI